MDNTRRDSTEDPGDNTPPDEGPTDAEVLAAMKAMTPGERLAAKMEAKGFRKRFRRAKKRGLVKHGADGKWVVASGRK